MLLQELQLGTDSHWMTLVVQRIVAEEMMHQLQRPQLKLPPSVGYSNANALIITDALGETLTIPWSLVSSYEVQLLAFTFVTELVMQIDNRTFMRI